MLTTANLQKRVIRQSPVAQIVGPELNDRVLPLRILPAIIISLDRPDAEVRAAFENQLYEARRRYPPALQKPGPASTDSQRDWSDVILSWVNHEILPIAEFTIWRSSLSEYEKSRYTKTSFARARGRAEYSTTTAEKALQKAISNLHMLNNKLRVFEDILDDDDHKLVAEWTSHFEAEKKMPDTDA